MEAHPIAAERWAFPQKVEEHPIFSLEHQKDPGTNHSVYY